jgi:glycosyltransferase involved in cell wall biosynthesis
MHKHGLAVVIIAKDAQSSIRQALESASWADEIIVLDDHSIDKTVEIAKQFTSNIFTTDKTNFAAKRSEGLEKITTEWILYLDTDEIITSELRQEVIKIIQVNQPAAYKIRRQNFFLGTKMYPDTVDRLFHRSVIKGWSGEVHESPIIKGEVRQLKHSLIHHTHTDITSMLTKTNKWSEFEADLRIKANHPPVAWWRLVRITLTVVWHQFIQLGVGNSVGLEYLKAISKSLIN